MTVGGQTIDGSGVGVAVVDSGADQTHPDLAAGIGENVKVLPGGVAIPLPISDTASLGGHGTHVAGTIVGDGSASGGTYHGAAPGSTVHSVSGGVAISMAFALDSLEWVLDNHDQVTPGDPRGEQLVGLDRRVLARRRHLTRWSTRLVADGVAVVFAAGNSGGDGSSVATSPQCQNPTPGVICVAAADDLGTGIA